jgi:hypothetical protein
MMSVFNAVVRRGWWAVVATVACVAGMLGVIPAHAAGVI